MATKSKTNGFVTFLETLRSTSARREPVGASLKLWSSLASSEPRAVTDLMHESDMDFVTFAESLQALREAGLVELVGEPGNETVQLTPYGEEVARPKR
jgi:predicted transcriptional regulator